MRRAPDETAAEADLLVAEIPPGGIDSSRFDGKSHLIDRARRRCR